MADYSRRKSVCKQGLIKSAVAGVFFAILSLSPTTTRAGGSFFYPHEGAISMADMEDVLSKNRLLPEENIKSVLIHKTAEQSVHLIQIRRGEAPHIHRTHDLIVTLKSGTGSLQMGKLAVRMNEGDWAFIPKGVEHYFVNKGQGIAVGLGIFVPAYDGADTVPVDMEK